MKTEHICGRPLGLRFDKRTGDLYIADAYFGLMKVGPEGGLATSLTTEAEGVPLRFTNDVDVDAEGNVYFTDSSTKYPRRWACSIFLNTDCLDCTFCDGHDSGNKKSYQIEHAERSLQ